MTHQSVITAAGKQRYLCQADGCKRTFILKLTYRACHPTVKRHVIEMSLNGSGVRDTARLLRISPNTVTRALKKSARP